MALGVGGVVWDLGGGEFELGFLLGGWVAGGGEGGEGVEEVLLVVLLDEGGEGLERGQDVVGYGEGELLRGLDVGGEGDAVELSRAGGEGG